MYSLLYAAGLVNSSSDSHPEEEILAKEPFLLWPHPSGTLCQQRGELHPPFNLEGSLKNVCATWLGVLRGDECG